MAEATFKIKDTLNQYVKALEKYQIRPNRIMLFGSHASGKPSEWSDIDISIISDDFEGKGILERQLILGRANQDLQAPLDLVGYTTSEADQCEPGSLLYEILQTGKEIQLKN